MILLKFIWQLLIDELGLLFQFRNDIHEDISYSMLENNAQIVLTDITIRHLGNRDIKHFREKNRRNYKMLTREIKSGKAHQLTYFHLVNTLMIFGTDKHLKQAIKYIDYTLENFGLKPQDPITSKLRTLRGLCCMKLFDKTKDIRLREAARADFLTSIAQRKGPEAAVNLAEILMQEEKWDDTIKLLEENLQDEQKPQNMPFDYKNIYLLMLFKLGDCYSHQQDWPKAENYFKQFMGINSDNLEVADRLAQVLRNMNKWDEAELLTVKAVNRWPSYFVGWLNLGCFEIANKRYITAEVFLQQALRIKPDFQEALVNLRNIQKMMRGKR